jgi:hypothetical protein
MPKITDDPIHSYSVGLQQVNVDFINQNGVGENMGAKLRSILTQCMEIMGNIADKDESILAYNQNVEGEKIWSPLPFPFDKKQGWQALTPAARQAGFICQIIQDTNAGTVQVWLAMGRQLNNCEECRKRILQATK